jgi:predicted SnoaL-like aldol condensation-catalyzing enzyme
VQVRWKAMSDMDATRSLGIPREGTGWGSHAPSLLLVLLLAVSAQAALVAGQFVRGPSIAESAGNGPVRQAARAFYLELDSAFQEGGTATLGDRLTDDFVDHGADGAVDGGREELVRFVRRVHGSAPEVRVRLTSMEVADDLVRTKIEFERASQPGQQWEAQETLLVRDGRIAERWAAGFPFQMSEPIADMTLGFLDWRDAEVTLVSLAPLPGNPTLALDVRGPAVLWLDSGSVGIRSDDGSMARGTPEAPIEVVAGEVVRFMQPDTDFAGRLLLVRRVGPPPDRYAHADANLITNSSVEGMLASQPLGTTLGAGPFYAAIESRVLMHPPATQIAMTIERMSLPKDQEFTFEGGSYPGIVFVEQGSIELKPAGNALQPGDAAELAAGGPSQGRSGTDEAAVVQVIRLDRG